MTPGIPGIDTNRIYFRDEFARMWGYDGDDEPRWFLRNFTNRGLKTFRTGKREVIHGKVLSDWILYNSQVLKGD